MSASIFSVQADALSASGRSSEKLSLPTLQSKMKCDPEGYDNELGLIYNQFKSSLELFQQQAALSYTSISGVAGDPTVAKDLSDRVMFLAHVAPFYPKQLAEFPKELVDFLQSAARTLPSGLRVDVTKALILMLNRKIVDISETLALFMKLQILGDKKLKALAFSHVIHSIKRMNEKHKNETKNRALQIILFPMLQEEDVAKAKSSLSTICDLYRRKVWVDDRTANAICGACFHSSSRIMGPALSFLLGDEKIEDDDSDASSDEDGSVTPVHHVNLSKEAIYKANNTGTTSSKKKKKAKLQRVLRSMKKQQRLSSEKDNNVANYSPLNHLKDAQGFAEKLFSRLQSCTKGLEVKMKLSEVVARTVGLHRLILLNFYPFLQKYVQPHQHGVTNFLLAAVHACHDMVPPDVVEPLFRQIVNQFVHDRSRTEVITKGLSAVREICLRIPLLMTDDLLQDLVLYRKSNEKAVSSAARSLLTLFREICPSLLIKKDRGRPNNPKARPKAFGEVTVVSDVPGVELLQDDDVNEDDDDDNDDDDDSDEEGDEDFTDLGTKESKRQKRKFTDFDGQLSADSKSLRALKRLAGEKSEDTSLEATDGILSNEDFKRIKELQAKKEAKIALTRHGLLRKPADAKSPAFKIPTSDQLSLKRIDATTLEANIRKKMNKEERLARVRAGRDEDSKYQSRTATKKNKSGGLSNRQKEHNKDMPMAAVRAKVAKSRQEKKRKQRIAAKQFRGRKAWK